jgi:putative flippase GtrA
MTPADGPGGDAGGREGRDAADGGAAVAPNGDGASSVDPPGPGPVAVLQDRVRALVAAERIGQFVSVGVAGATLETVIVALLTSGVLPLTTSPLSAKAVGAEASITLMFLLNDRWTFAAEGDAGLVSLLRRYAKSHVVRLGGLTVAFGTLFVLTSMTEVTLVVRGADLWPTVANAVAIGAGMTLNYVAESLVTWRVQDGG